MTFPVQYEQQMKKLLGKSYPDYRDSFSALPAKGLRVNELKISVSDFVGLWKRTEGETLEPIPWIHNGFFLRDKTLASKSPLYQAGLFYLQDPSAMTPAEYLPVESGDYVLDLCAAPGGKATELAAKLKGTGILYANDISASRAKALARNLEKAGVVDAFVTAASPEELSFHFRQFFDKILIDAPCSGEGMFRSQPQMMKHWEEEGPDYYAPLQKNILDQAAGMLRPGGMLMYSTCTFSPEEDDDQIESFLREHKDFEAVPFPDQAAFSHLAYPDGSVSPYIRLYPHKVRGEGQFAALLKRHGEASPRTARRPLEWKRKDELYLLPEGVMPEKGLHYLMTGLHVSTEKKGRTEKTQAFAMTRNGAEKTGQPVLSLRADDERLMRYLRGETIGLSEEERQNLPEKEDILVCLEDYPLGFGKCAGPRLKNKRDKGWRILF